MSSDDYPFVDLDLTWARARTGTTAVFRRTGETWEELGRTDAQSYLVRGLHPERVAYFAAAEVVDGLVEPEDRWEVLRVVPMADRGRPARPGTPAGLAVAQQGEFLHLRWDEPTDGVTVSHEVRIGASWEDGRALARVVGATETSIPWEASGAQTIWLGAIDKHDRPCKTKASQTVTVVPLDTHVTVATTSESGGSWGGSKIHVETDSGSLRLARLPTPFGAATGPFGDYAGVGCFSRYWSSGTYQTTDTNLGQIETVRLEVQIGADQPTDASLPFGAVRRPALGRRTDRDGQLLPAGARSWSGRQTWQMAPIRPVDLLVEIDTSQSSGGAWDGWRPWVPGTYTCWRYRFRVTLRGDGLRFSRLSTFTVRRRKYNHKDEGTVALVGTTWTAVTFTAPFQGAPVVTGNVVGPLATYGVTVQAKEITRTGCLMAAFDGAGNNIAADVGWHALGT